MLAVFVKNFINEGEINNGILLRFLVVTQILKFQIAMGKPKFVNNFKLRNDLYSDIRELLKGDGLMI
jgi:hypothetical protein